MNVIIRYCFGVSENENLSNFRAHMAMMSGPTLKHTQIILQLNLTVSTQTGLDLLDNVPVA